MEKWTEEYISSFENCKGEILKYFNHLPSTLRKIIIQDLPEFCRPGVEYLIPDYTLIDLEYDLKRDLMDLFKEFKHRTLFKNSDVSIPCRLVRNEGLKESGVELPIAKDLFILAQTCPPGLFKRNVTFAQYSQFLNAIRELEKRFTEEMRNFSEEALERYLIALSAFAEAWENIRPKNTVLVEDHEISFAVNLLKAAFSNIDGKDRLYGNVPDEEEETKKVSTILYAYAFFRNSIGLPVKEIAEREPIFIVHYLSSRQKIMGAETMVTFIKDLTTETEYGVENLLISSDKLRMLRFAKMFDMSEVLRNDRTYDVDNLFSYHYITADFLANNINENSMEMQLSYKDISFDIPEELRCMLVMDCNYEISLKEIEEVVEDSEELKFESVFRYFLRVPDGREFKLFTIAGKEDKVFGAYINMKKNNIVVGDNKILEILQITKDKRYYYEYLFKRR